MCIRDRGKEMKRVVFAGDSWLEHVVFQGEEYAKRT